MRNVRKTKEIKMKYIELIHNKKISNIGNSAFKTLLDKSSYEDRLRFVVYTINTKAK